MALRELYKNRNRQTIKRIIALFAPASILAIPYLLNLLAFSHSEAYHDVLLRAGLETGRFIHMSLIYAAISVVFLIATYFVMYKKDRALFSFVSSMLLSAMFLMNIQVITGSNVQPWHWGLRILEFLYFLLGAYIMQEGLAIISKRNATDIPGYFHLAARKLFSFLTNTAVLKVIIVLFFAYGFAGMTAAAYATSGIYTLTKGESDLYKWLDSNTTRDSTVMTLSVKESLQVSSFTHNNVYLPEGRNSVRPTEELVDRFAFAHNLYGVPDALKEKLDVDNDAVRLEYINKLYEGKIFGIRDFEKYYFIVYFFQAQFFYGRWDYQQQNPDISGGVGFYFPLAFREHVLQKLQSQSYKIYDYDYVIIGPYEKELNAALVGVYTKIYSNSEFDVYEVK